MGKYMQDINKLGLIGKMSALTYNPGRNYRVLNVTGERGALHYRVQWVGKNKYIPAGPRANTADSRRARA